VGEDAWDWQRALRELCSGMFNLDPFDWRRFDEFIVAAHAAGPGRPSPVELAAELARQRQGAWAAALVPVYDHGLRLLDTLAAMPGPAVEEFLRQRPVAEEAVEEAERLLRGE
jgi:hypothetical protein